VDPSAASFKTALYQAGWFIKDADNDVAEGIKRVATMLNLEKLKIHERCERTLKEIEGYSWDEKACARGNERPLKVDDHAMDALRYYAFTAVGSWDLM